MNDTRARSNPRHDDSGAAVAQPAKDNIHAVQEFEEASFEEIPRVQAIIERWSSFFGSPAYLAFIAIFVLAWIGYAYLARHFGWQHRDDPPFPWLQGLVTLNSLVLTVAVLIRQNRMSQQEEHRAHLDLQINLLTEQKVSLLIQRFNETHPQAPDDERAGAAQGDELAKPTNPVAMLQAIKNTSSHSDDPAGRDAGSTS